jgi:uncharacterized membrane protein YfcA
VAHSELLAIGLFLLGLATSFVGTNTGGSALVSIPAMIAMGIPAPAAIATARVAAIGSSLAGMRQYHKHGKVDYKLAWPAAILSVIGAALGALLMTHIPQALLVKVVAGLTLLLLAVSYILKQQINHEMVPSKSKQTIGYSLFLFTSMLSGFYGGQGIITTYIFVVFFHKTITTSAGTRKITALATAISAGLVYGFHGIIHWWLIFALMSGMILGASLGAAYALKKGDAWLAKIFNIVAILLSIKLLFSEF